MADITGNSQVLNGASGDGNISNHSSGSVLGVCCKSALTGTLTITGVTQSNGSAQSWVIPSTTSGFVTVPGSGKYFGGLNYVLSNPGADAGKAFIAFAPI
jgi:hypothetical protein